MSRQYLTAHTIDNAHPTDIFALTPTILGLLSASGSSSMKIHSVDDGAFEVSHSFNKVHKAGCHHLAASEDGTRVASVGFGGEMKIWSAKDGKLAEDDLTIVPIRAGEVWALAISATGQFLATASYDGKILVHDIMLGLQRIREYPTKGSFGLSVDISRDGRYVASGHENGSAYIFDNETSKLCHSLLSSVSPVRCVAFSPANRFLAIAGDMKTILLFDVSTGEQVATLAGHSTWVMSIDWSGTGEYLLSGSFDGKVKVWSIEQGACVATHSETDKTIWTVKWLPRRPGKSEMFVAGGANKSLSFYREASGG